MQSDHWAWQLEGWPRFRYDVATVQWELSRYAATCGRMLGGTAQLAAADQLAATLDLMVAEAISTAQIEGERLDRDSVRSSLRQQLGLDAGRRMRAPEPEAERMARLMLAVRKDLRQPITADTLFAWHGLVLGDGKRMLGGDVRVGAWRAEGMAIVSGPAGRERVHYEAPPPERVPGEMTRFLDWFNATHPVIGEPSRRLPAPIRAAVAHLWFEIIHPFDDGNGRIGRALIELALSQDSGAPVLLSLSSTLEKHREAYYAQLNQASRNLDIHEWLAWFCARLLEAQEDAGTTINFVLAKARFWDRVRTSPVNERQEKVLRRMFDAGPAGFEGGMTARKYVALTSCSKPTATRDLADLLARGYFVQHEGKGRSTAYDLAIEAASRTIQADS